MSGTLRVTTLQDGASATANLTFDSSGNVTAGNNLTVTGALVPSSSFLRNRIINGDMRIDQRNSGAAFTPTAIGANYTVDRWYGFITQASKLTFQQVAAPSGFTGFTNAMKVTVASAVTPGAGDAFGFNQAIEGYNIADWGWGAAGAKSVTVSFWAQSSVAGTYTCCLLNQGGTRSYINTYTLAANTPTFVSLTFPGDTSGTWATNNGIGVYVINSLGIGSSYYGSSGSWLAGNYETTSGAVSLVSNAGATFYISGVQVEVGSNATPFERRLYGTELMLCQRYLPAISYAGGTNPYYGAGMAASASAAYFTISLPVTPRVPPTGVTVSAAAHFGAFLPSTGTTNATGVTFSGANNHSAFVYLSGMSGLTSGYSTLIYMNNASALMYFTGCEL